MLIASFNSQLNFQFFLIHIFFTQTYNMTTKVRSNVLFACFFHSLLLMYVLFFVVVGGGGCGELINKS